MRQLYSPERMEMSTGDVIQIAAIIVGLIALSFQIYWQHKSSLKLQRDNFKQETKIKIYDDIAKKINEANEKIIKAQTAVESAISNLKLYLYTTENWNRDFIISDRAAEINDGHYATLNNINEVSRKVEQNLFINPKLSIFITAFNSIQYDIMESYQKISQKLMDSLPIEVNEDKQQAQARLLRLTIKRENVEYIEKYARAYKDNLITALSYMYDLTVETQNLLLGDVFGNEVPPRKPLDTNLKVITIKPENSEKLEKYYNEQTAWGKDNQEHIKAIKKQMWSQ